jgi:predicted dehydrogenase
MISRVLIVGLGSIGQRHLRLMRELLPNAEICVLRHKFYETLPQGADSNVFSIEDAIDFAPQIAVLANPAPWHMPVGIALAKTGCHFLVEKPLATDFEDARRLVLACQNSRTLLQVGYNLRLQPSLIYFKKLLEESYLGPIWSVRCEVGHYLPNWRSGKDYREGVSANKRLGGGVLLELSHELDYLRWCFGPTEWVSAVLSQQSNLEIDVEDYAHLTIGFNKNKNQTLIASLNLDFFRHDATRICTVIGERGTLRWDGISHKVTFTDENGRCVAMHDQVPEQDASYRDQLKKFLKCINTGFSVSPDGQDGLEIMKIIEAARQSQALQSRKVFVSKLTS